MSHSLRNQFVGWADSFYIHLVNGLFVCAVYFLAWKQTQYM